MSTSATQHLYKILSSAPPSPLPAVLPSTPLDTSSGYIHLSTATQTPATAARFFNTHEKLWVLKIRVDVFDDEGRGRIVWESAGDDGVFPHLYGGTLGKGVVAEVLEVSRKEGEGWGDVLGGLEG